ncbi:bel2 [White-tufted-ear marmoset simian foamy virus]|uniref:Bel2 n=1 Tax=White-tufted-ear marmoset simian foamy virus TaxID=2170205 RepID=D5JWV4_9RETR|nr:bel2 [White-tufted-ear marmoset simian foamy virus]ADE06003.1 bel2 [White-tufted-ear marmoset simian foamy virus]
MTQSALDLTHSFPTLVQNLCYASQEEIQATAGAKGKGKYLEVDPPQYCLPILSPTPLSGRNLRECIQAIWGLYQSWYKHCKVNVPDLKWRRTKTGVLCSETLPVPPLGSVTLLAWKDTTIMIICAGDDGFHTNEEGEVCSSTGCAQIIWPCKVTNQGDCQPYIYRLKRRHPLCYENNSLRHETSLQNLPICPYGEKGQCPLWEYRKDILSYFSGNPLTPEVLKKKCGDFAFSLYLVERLNLKDGQLPKSYFRAKLAWGSPKGSLVERVLWNKENKVPYYDPGYPFDEEDEGQGELDFDSCFSILPRITKTNTKETLQLWINKAVPAGFKLVTPDGSIIESKRSKFHPLDIENEENPKCPYCPLDHAGYTSSESDDA